MALSGTRKAALLLMSLDPNTAAELLKSARPETVTQIATELALLQAEGQTGPSPATTESVKEFFRLLRKEKSPGQNEFLTQMLHRVLGAERSQEVLGRINELVQQRDPFMPLRSASVKEIGEALKGESAHVAALVLAELPPKRSSQLVELLDDSIRSEAVRNMTAVLDVSPQARVRVANMVIQRLAAMRKARAEAAAGQAVAPVAADEEDGVDRQALQFRKVALLLRGLAKPMRDGLLESLQGQNADAAAQVSRLMITWDDLPLIEDRAVQEAMRGVDARKLALAFSGAAQRVTAKVRTNISERACAMLDEELTLLSSPKPEDIDAAREEVLDPFRRMNSEGNLNFIQEESDEE